jgi:hypothetical protein
MSSAQDRGAGYAQGAQQAGEVTGPAGTHRRGTGVPEQAGGYQDPGSYRGAAAMPDRGGLATAAGVVLAATLMILSGLLSFFVGLSILIKKAFYGTLPNYAFRWDVHTWGWAELIVGIVVFAAGACVLLGMTWAKIVGIVLAVISAVGNFLFLPYYPVWSIIVVAIDVFIIWALVRSFEARAEYR